MKQTILYAAFLLLLVGALPLSCLLPEVSVLTSGLSAAANSSAGPDTSVPTSEPQSAADSEAAASAVPQASATPDTPAETAILLQDGDTGNLLCLEVSEYVLGAAASEMPASWPEQALLAQMVASRSFVMYQKEHCADPSAGWITVAPARMQGYVPAGIRAARWGDAAEANEQKLQLLAAQAQNYLLTYNGSPAAACYHAISQGHTEASQNVWEEALPYLQGVDSPLDQNAEGYSVSVEYSPQQISDALAASLGINAGGDAAGWFGATQWYDTGYVRSIEVCGQSVAGVKLRNALGLRSNCFSISFSDGKFFILTRGYGHGVGLSQWGAKLMAEQGASWQEILAHYFPGTEICQTA